MGKTENANLTPETAVSFGFVLFGIEVGEDKN